MKNLRKLLSAIERRQTDDIYNYAVPDIWNCFDYEGEERINTPQGELIVNPHKFYSNLIRDYILPRAEGDRNYAAPLSKINNIDKARIDSMEGYKGGDWIKKATVYSSLIRTSTSWDHDRTGSLDESNIYHLKDTGTFVKSIALLPALKKMGINTLYMLPISKFSLKDKKGELGSPYGVSNFFKLDPNLKDPITGDDLTLEEEFKAFIEAVHILGMRVMIDIIPRSNSVNSDLIAEHPDWFYWIRYEDLNQYTPPTVPGLGSTVVPKPEFLPHIYSSGEVWEHIRKFVHNPRDMDSNKWTDLVNHWKANGGHILDLVREWFGLTVAPAFSDHINDIQPPWSDVTFFRMYLDHPTASKPFLGGEADHLAPYILFDTTKSNLYPGDVVNQELWDTLSSVIPFFQNNFGIDGARIDMGHALPKPLVDNIVAAAREIDPDFCFIAEELYPEKAKAAAEMGYNMIIGQGFYMQPRMWEFKTHEYYYSSKDLPIPVFASGETHDTPRLAARDGGRVTSKMLTILNMFMPNGVPFINSGQEVHEVQPMNTGLDCNADEAYRLGPNNPYNGKLALFDKVILHYLNHDRWELIDTLETVSQIRNHYIDSLTNLDNFVELWFDSMRTQAVGLGYMIQDKIGADRDNVLLVVANTNVYEEQNLWVDIGELRKRSGNQSHTARLIYSSHEWPRDIREFDHHGHMHLHMKPGEVKVMKM